MIAGLQRSTRGRVALAALIASLLVSGAGAAYVRQGATTVSVDTAVEAFRASTSASVASTTTTSVASPSVPTPAPSAGEGDGQATTARGEEAPSTAVPVASRAATPGAAATASPSANAPAAIEEGVYTYATDGYEETNALGGSRHDYPKETAITARRAECGGWTQRWEPLRERWDESDLCPEDGGNAVSVRRFTTYHEFFQRGQQQDFTCPEGSHVSRRGAPAGTTWTWRCTAGNSAIETAVNVVGAEPVDVGGSTIDAVHVHYSSKLSGGNRGTQEQHRWLHPETGLNLKIITDIDLEADSPFGAVSYVEHYTITLTSLSPRR